MTKPLISKADVLLNVTADNWETAVRTVGRVMQKRGLVEARFIDAMVDAVKSLGPYIVLAPGIAFPHARPQDGALATGIALITLDAPISFGSIDNDPVKIVIGLASTDNSSHLALLSHLCGFLEEDANVDAIRKATDEETVAALINQYEKEGVR